MRLKVNILFYLPEVVEQSVKDLSRVAKIKIFKKDQTYYHLDISRVKSDSKSDFQDKYFNYLLELQTNLNASQ